uniref:Uncharacterized protein n=1 Tax=Manihot esculenta TaxID=3983 RepID=A0A2C9WJ67_MANES
MHRYLTKFISKEIKKRVPGTPASKGPGRFIYCSGFTQRN